MRKECRIIDYINNFPNGTLHSATILIYPATGNIISWCCVLKALKQSPEPNADLSHKKTIKNKGT